jgi:pilus assembly protein CpaE
MAMGVLSVMPDVSSPAESRNAGAAIQVGIVDGAVAPGQVSALGSLFPVFKFETLLDWPNLTSQHHHILVAAVDANLPDSVSRAIQRLQLLLPLRRVLVLLHNFNTPAASLLADTGATVLRAPAGEGALALALERLSASVMQAPAAPSGQVVALLKAGGGVGATSLGVQAVMQLAQSHGADRVCFADLDLQSGSAALYFDLAEALTISDCLAVGDLLADTQFATALASHGSGARVLAATLDTLGLDMLTPSLVQTLIRGLRRDFSLTIIDLPPVWTAWTDQALQLADRILLVTNLSVLHVHLTRRQLDLIAQRGLNHLPLTLVCNRVTPIRQSLLSRKAAEAALGRPFDIQLPDDEPVMMDAVNQGVALSAVRRGTKLEKAIGMLAETIAAEAFAVGSRR